MLKTNTFTKIQTILDVQFIRFKILYFMQQFQPNVYKVNFFMQMSFRVIIILIASTLHSLLTIHKAILLSEEMHLDLAIDETLNILKIEILIYVRLQVRLAILR